jgi:hypothetical protein
MTDESYFELMHELAKVQVLWDLVNFKLDAEKENK